MTPTEFLHRLKADGTDAEAAARALVVAFPAVYGTQLLQLVERDDPVTAPQLIAFATAHPGQYLARNVFLGIKGRAPNHAEAIQLGRLLGALALPRKKDGPHTLWTLDTDTINGVS